MWNLISTSLFTVLLDPRAFSSLLTGTSAFFGHVFHMPHTRFTKYTSIFLISPTSRPQTENFSTEPSANSSFPSGRSSHSLSVWTFWGPMMMMYTRLSVLESYSVPVVTVMWYGITATNRGLVVRKRRHIHTYTRLQKTIPSEGAAVHAERVHITLNSSGKGVTPCSTGLQMYMTDWYSTYTWKWILQG